MHTTTSTVRRALCGALAAGVLGGAAALTAIPVASAAPDPCEASKIADTIASVSGEASDYLDSHPETNAALTNATKLQGPQALAYLKSYFDANPEASQELQDINEPLVTLSGQCKLPIAAPQALQMLQALWQGGLPGGVTVPGLPATGGVAVPVGTGPLPGPATSGTTGITGTPGITGTTGTIATPGITGTTGTPGITGITGTPGVAGGTGSPGSSTIPTLS